MPTAIIELEFEELYMADVIKAWSDETGWTATIEDRDGNEVPNPENREQWFQRTLADFLMKKRVRTKGDDAVEVADPETVRETAETAARTQHEAAPLIVRRKSGAVVRGL